MDTIARHPLTALAAVTAFVALCLHFGTPDPSQPSRPASPPPAAANAQDFPGADLSRHGNRVTVRGRAAQVATGDVPVVLLTAGRSELRCRFPCAGPGASCPLAALREGEEVAVEGVVAAAEEGGIALADCRLVPRQ